MPHIVLEYSTSLREAAVPVLQRLHDALAEVESFEEDRIKSRAVAVEDWVVGAGPPRVFAHVTVTFSSGRSDELRTRLGRDLLGLLAREVCPGDREVARSVEIRQFEPGMYFTDHRSR